MGRLYAVSLLAVYTCSISMVLAGFFIFTPQTSLAAISSWQKGASIEPRWDGDFSTGTFKQSVDNLAATHANYVSLVIPYYQSAVYTTDLQPGWNTPTDQSLRDAVSYIHSKGMGVMFVIHLETYDGQWRAQINPPDRGAWYLAYSNMLNHYGTIAQEGGVEWFCVGVELINMASQYQNGSNAQNWKAMIDQLRTVYNGKLTYSAQWGEGGWFDEKNYIGFWDKLDAIGISAYFNLNSSADVPALKGAWDNWNNSQIRPLSNVWNKPVLFTEIGYKSVSGSHYQPWNYNWGGPYDADEQARDYTALFEYWNNYPYMIGVQLWNWSSDPNAGGEGNTDYTPQHKKAQDVMTQFFGSSPGPSSTPTPTPGPINIESSATGSSGSVGQPVSINAQIKNNSSALQNIIVDLEIYNSGGGKAFQKYFEGETINQSQTKQYTTSWTPTATGAYTLKLGVFSNQWSQNYHWNSNATTITIGSNSIPTPTPTPSPTPGPASVNIWWPSNGSTISGTQPFKAMVPNRPVSNYQMFWQVDGDQLNGMPTSKQDYPHKEAMVDVSGWTWKGMGPYKINFVAKDLSNNLIAQRSIDIFRP